MGLRVEDAVGAAAGFLSAPIETDRENKKIVIQCGFICRYLLNLLDKRVTF